MAGEMFYTLFNNYLGQAELGKYYIYILNDYFPFATPFWLIGFAIFMIIQWKTKNFAFSGAVTSVYFFIIQATPFVTSIYVKFAMKYVGIIIGIFVGYYIYKTLKGGR